MSLLHDQWHRVRALRPRWRTGVRMDRQRLRGQRWYMLSDERGTRTVRLDERAYAIIGRCDGQRSLEQIWTSLLGNAEADATTQGDLMSIVARGIADGLLDCDGAADLQALGERTRQTARRMRRARRVPWALRVPLGDPSRVLDRCAPLARAVFGPAGAIGWAVLMALASWLALDRWMPLGHDARLAMGSPSAWLVAWLAFVPMKAVHEAAHALAVKRFGGNVHEAGIGLLMGMPAPYVDASQANRFARPGQRALVSAAGILAELALAALGLVVWASSDPDAIAHRVGLVVALTGTVSTLWFNANPLARMDGYYLLTDLAQLPNLAERSGTWWREQALRALLRTVPAEPLQPAPRERRWLIAHAPLAFAYRVGLCAWLTMTLGGWYAPAGFAMALLSVVLLGVLPITRLLRAAADAAEDRGQRDRARWRLGAALATLAIAAVAVPLPDRVIAVGVVWVPEPAQIRAGDDGFVTTLLAGDGQPVQAGDPIARLDDPLLHAEVRRLDAQRERLTVSRSATLFNDPAQGAMWAESLRQTDDERARVDERIASLSAAAPLAGRLVLPFADDLPGRFFRRGERIADVLDETRAPTVRVVLPAQAATRIAGGERSVRLGFAHLPWQTVDADLLRDAPAPVERLPSAALGQPAGGPIEIDPTDRERLKPLHPVYAIDVRARRLLPAYPGERVDVSIDCGWRSLAGIAARELRHSFRAGFSATAI